MNGLNIKLIRLERGLSQQKLSELIGITESQLSKIETDRIRPSAALVERLSKALGCAEKYITGQQTVVRSQLRQSMRCGGVK